MDSPWSPRRLTGCDESGADMNGRGTPEEGPYTLGPHPWSRRFQAFRAILSNGLDPLQWVHLWTEHSFRIVAELATRKLVPEQGRSHDSLEPQGDRSCLTLERYRK